MRHICDTIVTRESACLESLLSQGIQGVELTLLKRMSHLPVQADVTRTSKNTKRRFENEEVKEEQPETTMMKLQNF